MASITLQQRHISVTARLFGEKIGSDVVASKNKGGRPSNAEIAARNADPPMPDDKTIAHKAVMDALYKKAIAGDPAAIRQWNDLNAPETNNPFNIEINITPYNIQDRSIPRIVQQADTPVIMEVFEGFKTRLEADEAPQLLKDILRSFRLQYDEWARKAYAPKDV